MPESIEEHRNEVLSDTAIDFFDEHDVEFHFNSGREWESETTTEERDDGTTVEKESVCTIPCPHVRLYNRGDKLHAIVALPHLPNPIIIAHLRSTGGEPVDLFLDELVASLEDCYEGIDEVTEFTAEDADLGSNMQAALDRGTPESVGVPATVE